MKEELNIKETFTNMIAFIIRNKKILLIFVLIGIISVIGYQKLKKQYYETHAICTSGISEYERTDELEEFSQRTAVDMINLLSSYISNRDYIALSELLDIDQKTAKSIKKIEAEQLYQQDMNEKYYALNKFMITLIIHDNTVINEIESGLLNYFNTNQYITGYYNTYQELSKSLIDKIDLEIEDLNNIRLRNINNKFDIRSENVLAGPNKSLSNEIITLYHMQQEAKTNQKHLKPLAFVQQFVKVNQPEDDVLVWSILGGVISFLLGTFFALAKESQKHK